ncbi:MAG: hypothetical protein K5768_06020 [Firmicutes bacterium]|nr:hypothetical protein [Bacillota bacterium]
MKKLRGLSLVLCITMLLGIFNLSAYAQNTITAYVTISMYGDIVKDTNANYVAEAPVELTGKESYTLDDVFVKAHDLFYEGGAIAGYETEVSNFGYGDSLGIKKVWGDTSGKFGYQINGGAVYVSDLTTSVNNGDYIDLCIYENYWPDTEDYSYFDTYQKTVEGHTTELTLYYTYYDENWIMHTDPCENATVLVNGKETNIKTNENGKCTLSFDEYGEYIISAKKTKVIIVDPVEETEATVSAITAPVCVVSAVPVSVDCKYQLNITVDADIDFENSKTMVVGYRDGKLIDMVMDNIVWSGNTATVYLNKRATDISLFMWNSVSEQEPCIKAEKINLK